MCVTVIVMLFHSIGYGYNPCKFAYFHVWYIFQKQICTDVSYRLLFRSVSVSNLNEYDETIYYGDVFFEIIKPEDLEYTYRLRPAKNFGAAFNKERFKPNQNLLVLAQPRDACTDLENSSDLNGNVALIERGDCSFLTKALMAQEAGAIAAIITDPSDSLNADYYIEMVHDNSSSDVDIPSAFLLGQNGKMIINTLEKYGLDRAVINIPLNLTFTPPEMINHPPWAMS